MENPKPSTYSHLPVFLPRSRPSRKSQTVQSSLHLLSLGKGSLESPQHLSQGNNVVDKATLSHLLEIFKPQSAAARNAEVLDGEAVDILGGERGQDLVSAGTGVPDLGLIFQGEPEEDVLGQPAEDRGVGRAEDRRGSGVGVLRVGKVEVGGHVLVHDGGLDAINHRGAVRTEERARRILDVDLAAVPGELDFIGVAWAAEALPLLAGISVFGEHGSPFILD